MRNGVEPRCTIQPVIYAAGVYASRYPAVGPRKRAGPGKPRGWKTGRPAAPSSKYKASVSAPRRAPSRTATRSTPKVWPVIGTGVQGSGNTMCAHNASKMFAAAMRRTSAAKPSIGKILSARTPDCGINTPWGFILASFSWLPGIIPEAGGLLGRLFRIDDGIIEGGNGTVLVSGVNFSGSVEKKRAAVFRGAVRRGGQLKICIVTGGIRHDAIPELIPILLAVRQRRAYERRLVGRNLAFGSGTQHCERLRQLSKRAAVSLNRGRQIAERVDDDILARAQIFFGPLLGKLWNVE